MYGGAVPNVPVISPRSSVADVPGSAVA
jgi:hypothetical protein